MIYRTQDLSEVLAVTENYPDYFTFDFEPFLRDDKNVVLKSGENLAFAEYKSEGLYWVHFCFHTARGRDAIRLTQQMFKKFCTDFPVRLAIGLIHHENRKALWLIRQVGFKSLGLLETQNGLCEAFYSLSTKDT